MQKIDYNIDYFSKDNLNEILKYNSNERNINLFISDRAGRKSSAVQLKMFDEWEKEKKPIFILTRRKTDEAITEHWFSDYAREYIEKKGYSIDSKKLDNYIVALILIQENKRYIFGYGLFLSVSQKYKSNSYVGFNHIKYVLLEEAVPQNQTTVQHLVNVNNLDKEILDLISIGSTVCRYTHPQYILLGNDIKGQVLNPTTLALGLLDKIENNVIQIFDKKIGDYNYTILFYYPVIKNSIPHWLEPNHDNVEAFCNKKLTFQHVQFLCNDNIYYLYKNSNFSYITNNLKPDIEELVINEDLFYKSVFLNGAIYELYNEAKKDNNIYIRFIERLQFMGAFQNFNELYTIEWDNAKYTYKWNLSNRSSECKFFDIDKMRNSSDSQLLTEFDNLAYIASLFTNTTIFSNYYIKIQLQQLYHKYVLLK